MHSTAKRGKTLVSTALRKFGVYSHHQHHEILGVPYNATAQEIKQRYLYLAKQLHPDVAAKDPTRTPKEISDEFARVKQAYETLRDSQSRKAYDHSTYQQHPTEDSMNQGFDFKSYYQHQQKNDSERKARSEQSVRQKALTAVNIGLVLLTGSLTWYYLKNREPTTEHEVRRGNIMLANENINSSPSAIQKRMEQYEKERIAKQFRIVVVEKKLNRHGNAFISESDLKDSSKRGKTMTAIEKPNLNEIESISGIRKAQPEAPKAKQGVDYM